MENRFFQKYAKLILALFVLTFPLVYLGSEAAFSTSSNQVQDWLPKKFEETTELNWFIKQFGGDDLMVVSWDSYTVGDPHAKVSVGDARAEELVKRLRQPVEIEGKDSLTLFRKVSTAAEAQENLAEILFEANPREDLTSARAKALAALENWIGRREKKRWNSSGKHHPTVHH